MRDNAVQDRRCFLRDMVVTIGAARLGIADSASAQLTEGPPSSLSASSSGQSNSFGSPKQIDAGALRVAYAEAGPSDGPAVILLHGWPYDIHSYADVTPLLAPRGYRVVVPFLRGFGATRFLSGETPRNAQQSALAMDVIALMDALGIDSAIIGGCDWGARTANILGALWPERCKALVSVSGYLIGSREANRTRRPKHDSAEKEQYRDQREDSTSDASDKSKQVAPAAYDGRSTAYSTQPRSRPTPQENRGDNDDADQHAAREGLDRHITGNGAGDRLHRLMLPE